MLDEVTLEQRLLTLEQTVSQLKQQVESQSPPENWLTQVVGSISDETAFMEALEHQGKRKKNIEKLCYVTRPAARTVSIYSGLIEARFAFCLRLRLREVS